MNFARGFGSILDIWPAPPRLEDISSDDVDGALAQVKRGQWTGLTVVLSILVLAYWAMRQGMGNFAEKLVTTTVIAVAAMLVLGRAPAWLRERKTDDAKDRGRSPPK